SRMQATTRPNGSSGNILISSSREDETHMVAREHRVLGFRPPATLREDAIVRHALAEHADLFQDPDAGGILQRHVRLDAMQLQVIETEGQEAQRNLGGKSASRVNVVHAKAEARNPWCGSRQAGMANDLPVAGQPRNEVVKPAVFAFTAMLHVARDAL